MVTLQVYNEEAATWQFIATLTREDADAFMVAREGLGLLYRILEDVK